MQREMEKYLYIRHRIARVACLIYKDKNDKETIRVVKMEPKFLWNK